MSSLPGIIVQIIAYIAEYITEHGFRENTGIGVVARAMIAGENAQLTDICLCAVAEFMF